METKIDLLNFCNDAVFYDYKNIGFICELNPVRTFIFNKFYKTIPYTRILVSLGIIDDIILKISNDDIENILDDIHNLRENILHMLSRETTIRDEKNANVDKNQSDKENECKYKHTLPVFRLNSSK